MAKKKNKRLLYQVASYPEQRVDTLEKDLRNAYENLPLVKDRVVDIAGKRWTGLNYRSRQGYFAFQFSLSVPGEAASTLPTGNLDADSVEMNTTEAPLGHDFSDGDVICLISGNHLFSCASTIRATTITSFLRALFDRADLDDELAMQVAISKPSNLDKLSLIQQEGIKAIHLKTTLNGNEFARLQNTKGDSFLRKVWRAISQEDVSLAESANISNARFSVSLSRSKLTGNTDLSWLEEEARAAISGNDSYKIETQSGKIITESEITIAKYAQMDPFGKSVFVDEAIRKLEDFKNDFFRSPVG